MRNQIEKKIMNLVKIIPLEAAILAMFVCCFLLGVFSTILYLGYAK